MMMIIHSDKEVGKKGVMPLRITLVMERKDRDMSEKVCPAFLVLGTLLCWKMYCIENSKVQIVLAVLLFSL